MNLSEGGIQKSEFRIQNDIKSRNSDGFCFLQSTKLKYHNLIYSDS